MPEMSLDELLADVPDSLPVDAVEQVELALFNKAKGGLVTFREQLDRNGKPVPVRYEHPPDPVAASKFLAARDPARYGGQAGQAMPPLVIVTDPEQLRAMLSISQAKKPMATVTLDNDTGGLVRQDGPGK